MKKLYWLYIAAAVVVLIVLVSVIQHKKNATPVVLNDSQMVFYFGQGCPHCANVEKFVADNNVAQKVSFVSKEVWYNATNFNEFSARAQKCGIPQSELGVPLFWNGQKCLSGDVDIINYFQTQINAK